MSDHTLISISWSYMWLSCKLAINQVEPTGFFFLHKKVPVPSKGYEKLFYFCLVCLGFWFSNYIKDFPFLTFLGLGYFLLLYFLLTILLHFLASVLWFLFPILFYYKFFIETISKLHVRPKYVLRPSQS